MYNLDQEIDRRGTNSKKYDELKKVFGKEELLPLWIADMDFQSPPPILEAVKKQAEHGIFGYSFRDSLSEELFIEWVERRYNWRVEKSWLASSPGIVTALALAVRIFTQEGEKVLIQTPVYPPFFSVVEDNGRELVTSPLQLTSNGYEVNWDHFEQSIESGVKLFILCNSHNPLGKAWSREELKRMGEICLKNNVLIFSDEIHADLALFGNQHNVMASISEEISEITITAMAPSKTFNIAGLLNSVIVAQSPKLLARFKEELERLHLSGGNIFGNITMAAAYSQESEEWLKEVSNYIGENVEWVESYLKEHLPSVTFVKPASSFLLWLNFTETGLSHQEIKELLLEKAKVALNDGTTFGECGAYHFRLNVGAPRHIVEEGVKRIVKAFNE